MLNQRLETSLYHIDMYSWFDGTSWCKDSDFGLPGLIKGTHKAGRGKEILGNSFIRRGSLQEPIPRFSLQSASR